MTEYNDQQIYKSITTQNLKNIEYLKNKFTKNKHILYRGQSSMVQHKANCAIKDFALIIGLIGDPTLIWIYENMTEAS